MRAYKDLTLSDDFMFCKVMQNNPSLCKRMLELILNKKINRISYPETQKSINIAEPAKSVRLDIYVEDEACAMYNIEMQVVQQEYLPKRSRYYQGMMDLNTIEKGKSYKELRKSYVIFLCMFSPFKEDVPKALYTFENTCREYPNIHLGDEAYKVFVNPFGAIDGYPVDDEFRQLLTYLRRGVIEGHFASLLDDAVKKVRKNEAWEAEYMVLQAKYQDYYDEGHDNGRAEGIVEGQKKEKQNGLINNYKKVKRCVEDLNYSFKDALFVLDISEEDYRKGEELSQRKEE